MKLISSLAKRWLNNASPGLHDARLGDIVEDLQKRVASLEKASTVTPPDGSNTGSGGQSGNSTWDTA